MRHFFSGEKRSSSTTGPLEEPRPRERTILDFSNISDRSHERKQVARFAINYYRLPKNRERGRGEEEGNFAANTSFFGDDEIDKNWEERETRGEGIEMHHRTIRNRFRGYNFEDMNRRARGIKEERRGESFLVLRGTG